MVLAIAAQFAFVSIHCTPQLRGSFGLPGLDRRDHLVLPRSDDEAGGHNYDEARKSRECDLRYHHTSIVPIRIPNPQIHNYLFTEANGSSCTLSAGGCNSLETSNAYLILHRQQTITLLLRRREKYLYLTSIPPHPHISTCLYDSQ